MKNNFNILMWLLFLIITPILCSIYPDNNTCLNKDLGCLFNISYNNTISPKIPNSFPGNALLSTNKSIYLTFFFPYSQKQKSFYLEAYDISDGKTIISNGDCYFINTTLNAYYEMRIYKNLRNDSYVRFGFLGLSKNFNMIVYLHFNSIINSYYSGIALTYNNSLNKSNIPELKENSKDEEENIIEQNYRITKAKEKCSKIMKDIFNNSLDMSLLNDSSYNFISVPVSPYLLVTISYSVEKELKKENIFQSESNVLSETTIKKAIISEHFNGLDFLKGKIVLRNNIFKIIELYNKRLKDIIFKFGAEFNYTLIISTDKNNNFAIYNLRYYYKNTENIYYEIQIKIQYTNLKLKELIIKQADSYDILPFRLLETTPEMCNMSSLGKIFRDLLGGCFYVVGVSAFMYVIKDTPLAYNAPIFLEEGTYSSQATKIGAFLLQMEPDDDGNYHAIFDCWQQHFGYTKFYDFIFDIFTDMECNNEGIFTYNNQNYILWAWKGDYINLGAGAELGIYYGGKSRNSPWKVDKSLAMPMTLTLTYRNSITLIDNWDNWGTDAWWITAFNPRYKMVKAHDLTAYFTVQFKNEDMFNEFAKTPRNGWSYNTKNKIANLIL